MSAYYNELDPFAAAWLRELITEGLIADGEVDGRSITDVRPADLRGFTQCHFFAGIGGWSYALRLAGWPDDRPVWTGSCPCQPFSAAGQSIGGRDDRHLWPHWARLIRECHPVTVLGEQVESAIAHGWLDAVCDDLEAEGYACGAICLPAASVGAPHLRQRLWFVADAHRERRDEYAQRDGAPIREESRHASRGADARGRGVVGQSFSARLEGHAGDVGDRHESRWFTTVAAGSVAEAGAHGDMADADGGESRDGELQRGGGYLQRPQDATDGRPFWADVEWIACRDGKSRPTQPGLFPLAHGVPQRVGTLRGAGNAIVPHVAAEVIRAFLEIAR